MTREWNEEDHPRDYLGQFTESRDQSLFAQRMADMIGVQRGQSPLAGRDFFHGTVIEGLTEIVPASKHGRGVIFPHVTDRNFAYATPDERTAWTYAELAYNAADRGVPRVYRVRAVGPTEEDPQYDQHGRSRSNYAGDIRSRWKFIVVEEVPMPEAMGTPSDWDPSYGDGDDEDDDYGDMWDSDG
jgi:hypothetical protein